MFHIPGSFILKRCDACGLGILDPQPSKAVLAKHYPTQKYYSYAKRKNGFFSMMRRYLFDHYYDPTLLSWIMQCITGPVPALPHRRPPGKILDIGCGSGDTLVSLQSLGWDVYGLDIDKNAIRTAQKRGLTNVSFGGYIDVLTYPDEYFDVIRMYHVIEHLDDPDRCIAIIRKKLKPSGELVIGTPNIESMVSRIFQQYWYNLDSPRHLFLFSPRTLKTLVTSHGFQSPAMTFCSAGGCIGSIQYMLHDTLGISFPFIHTAWIVILFYPFEWLLDRLRTGDVFVLHTTRE